MAISRRANRFYDAWKKANKDPVSREWVQRLLDLYDCVPREERAGVTFEQWFFCEPAVAPKLNTTSKNAIEFVYDQDKTQPRALEPRQFRALAAETDVVIESLPPTIIKPGAFKKTIKDDKDKIKLLWMHDSFEPIGKPVDLQETDRGLEMIGQVSEIPRGNDALQLMRDGVITDVSIGWTPMKFKFEDIDGVVHRIVSQLQLWEVSFVSWGANPGAKITEVNSLEMALEGHAKGKVQSVIFTKEKWTVERAKRWLAEHDFHNNKVDETENTYRFRQFEPSLCKAGTFVTLTKNFPAGVSALVCDTKGADAAEPDPNLVWLQVIGDLEYDWTNEVVGTSNVTTISIGPKEENNQDSDEDEDTSLPSLVEDLADSIRGISESEEPFDEELLGKLADASETLRLLVERERVDNTLLEKKLAEGDSLLTEVETLLL